MLLMQSIVDLVSNGSTYSWHLRQFFSACAPNACWAAKVHEQLPSPFWTNTNNLFQLALITLFAPPGSVPRDREPVRLVSDMLKEMRSFRTPVNKDFTLAQKVALSARNSINSLSDAKGFH